MMTLPSTTVGSVNFTAPGMVIDELEVEEFGKTPEPDDAAGYANNCVGPAAWAVPWLSM